jgi:PTH1 family peptidyl-tRNA hydrolase
VWLVVGLGNPGKRYERTRHNIGFLAVERFAERWSINPDARDLFGGKVGEGRVRDERCVVLRPQSFMNLSGQPVVSVAGFYKVPLEKVVVVHDDVDLPFADVRCKLGGGHGGHNGLRDISRAMTGGHPRVRFGVGRPPEGWETADWVLGKWSGVEEAALPTAIDQVATVLESILQDGVSAAMNRFNTRPKAGVAPSASA